MLCYVYTIVYYAMLCYVMLCYIIYIQYHGSGTFFEFCREEENESAERQKTEKS